MSIKITTESFIKKAKCIHGNKYNYDKVKYIHSELPVIIYCNKCNQDFLQTPSNHTNKTHARGCPRCGKNKAKKTKCKDKTWFMIKAEKIHGKRYNYDQVKYINNYTKVKIFCKKCQRYFWQTPGNHLFGQGCPCTGNNRKETLEEFVKKARIIHGDKYDYSEAIYVNRMNKIHITCLNCHKKFNQTPAHHLQGSGCPHCNKSIGENHIQQWLDGHNIIFKFQHRFDDCRDKKPLPFDFYLPDYNLCIEYQGQQHYLLTQFSSDNKNLQKNLDYVQMHDRMKREYCKKNNIWLLEIKYNENIDEILENFF